MKCGILFVFLIFLIESIGASLIPRIAGGENADIEDHPYEASIRQRGGHFCGGAIISERHILTAAHCVHQDSAPYQHLSVHTGTGSSTSTGNSHRIATIKVHPGWSFSSWDLSFLNDIAVITLADAISFNAQQQKIDLASLEVISGTKGILTGWGHTTGNNGRFATQLQKLRMTLLTNNDCQPQHTVKINKKQLCAYYKKGHGACFGDSGSPLVISNQLVGIVSWLGDKNCVSGKPDVYTNVYAYKDFIISEMTKSANS